MFCHLGWVSEWWYITTREHLIMNIKQCSIDAVSAATVVSGKPFVSSHKAYLYLSLSLSLDCLRIRLPQ